MSGEDLQTCLGLPDQRATLPNGVQLLTYNANAAASGGVSVPVPVVGTVSLTGGGYCHVTVKLRNDAVTEVRYSGKKDELGAPDAVCAPVVEACVQYPEHYAPVATPFYSPDHLADIERRERGGH